MNDSFSALHPALTFCYFAAVLLPRNFQDGRNSINFATCSE